jgi:hypothetical protein
MRKNACFSSLVRAGLALAAVGVALAACSTGGPGPQATVGPAYPIAVATVAPIETAAAPPEASGPAWRPAAVVGAPIGPPLPKVEVQSVEGLDADRARVLSTRAATAVKGCAGAGSVLHLRIDNVGTNRDIQLAQDNVLDAIKQKCVIDALSTVQIDDAATNQSTLLHAADRYSAQLVLSW